MTIIPAIGFLYLLPWIYSADTKNILGGLEQDASKGPNRIFSECTEIALGAIRTVAETHIYSSLYHHGTPAGIL